MLSDVTLGSSRLFSIIHGDYLSTLSFLKHGTKAIHWLLACGADDVSNHQSHNCSNSLLPNSKIILSEIAERSESKSRELKTPISPAHEFCSSALRSPETRLNSLWECRQLHPVSPFLRHLEFISILFGCADNFTQLLADLGLGSFWMCRRPTGKIRCRG